MERLEQRTWFRLFLAKNQTPVARQSPYSPDISRYHQKMSESSALVQLFRHFPYNENLMRALNTISLKCCLPSTDTIGRQEKIHICLWKFKVTLCKHASLKSTRFWKKMSDTFLTDLVHLFSSDWKRPLWGSKCIS
jgi:hypothetical protein